MTDPGPDPSSDLDAAEAARAFDDWATWGWGAAMEEEHARAGVAALEAMPSLEARSFLDIGCGNGWAVRWAMAQGAGLAVGADVALGMVREARRVTPSGAGPRHGWVQAPLHRLPFRDACFDQVFSMEALYYATDLQEALAEVVRVLRPGGRLDAVFEVYGETVDDHDLTYEESVPLWILTEAAWKRVLDEACLEDVGSRRIVAEAPLDPSPDDDRRWSWEAGSLHVWATRR